MYTELSLSGGGMYGFAMLGALKHVHLEPITHIAGTSVGSLIGALLCVVSVDSIINLITQKHIDLESYNIDETIEHCGLLNQERVLCHIQGVFKDTLHVDNPTFQQLYDYSKKKLTISGTNLAKQAVEWFSVDTTPTMSVLTALKISMTIPFVFHKVEYNGTVYADGGLVAMYPHSALHEPQSTQLCVYVSLQPHSIRSVFDYAYAAIWSAIKVQEPNHPNTIWIGDTSHYSLLSDAREVREKLLNSGDQAGSDYFKKRS